MSKLKVIIADDENMVCVVIEKTVHWDELNMELIGVVHNGIELV